jgi:hypothetical protein
VHPAGNSDVVASCARYRGLLADDATFTSVTLEDVLAAAALPKVGRRRHASAVHPRRRGARAP